MWEAIIGAVVAGVLGLGGVCLGWCLSKKTAIELENNRQKGELKIKLIEFVSQLHGKWTCGEVAKSEYVYKKYDAELYSYIENYASLIKGDISEKLKEQKNKWKNLQDHITNPGYTMLPLDKESHLKILNDILEILNQ